MKIEKSDILQEIDRYNWAFHKCIHVPDKQIVQWVKEANEDIYWIKNEGLWAFVEMRIRRLDK